MVLKVKVNVFVRDVKEIGGTGRCKGKFFFQQVDPLSPVVIHKNGTVNLKKAGVTDAVEITYVWCSTAVELDDELVATKLVSAKRKSFWIRPKVEKPGRDDPAASSGETITVTDAGTMDELVMHDTNELSKHYTYCFAVQLGLVTPHAEPPWLVCDPKIINTGSTRTISSFRTDTGGSGYPAD